MGYKANRKSERCFGCVKRVTIVRLASKLLLLLLLLLLCAPISLIELSILQRNKNTHTRHSVRTPFALQSKSADCSDSVKLGYRQKLKASRISSTSNRRLLNCLLPIDNDRTGRSILIDSAHRGAYTQFDANHFRFHHPENR